MLQAEEPLKSATTNVQKGFIQLEKVDKAERNETISARFLTDESR